MDTHTTTYALASWVFLRMLGLVYLVAFLSLASQIKGLIGYEGILPAAEFLRKPPRWNPRLFFSTPTLCWLNQSDRFLGFLCWGGVMLSILLAIGLAPLPVLILLWLFYLSLVTAGRVFLAYQWDHLLLETGFLAFFLAPCELSPRFPPLTTPSPVVIWLLWWLLFRLMFGSGCSKLTSGDRHWRNLTALTFHYETQPLPTVLAWHAHQLKLYWHKITCAAVLAIEIAGPFLIVGPPTAKFIAAGLFCLLMLAIQLTGNYAFFNLLTMALCVPLLDDGMWLRLFGLGPREFAAPSATAAWISLIPAVLVTVLSPGHLLSLFNLEIHWPRWWRTLSNTLAPFRLVNAYGLFPIMNIERPELMVEGSDDGKQWQAYEFKHKPGDVMRAPGLVAPHQPRLVWQMWFAGMGYYQNHPWVGRLLARLQQGAKPVESLLKVQPFENHPPRFIRCVLFDYRFTSIEQRRETGAWWRRERRGFYGPLIGN
jgi:hypothetical protein